MHFDAETQQWLDDGQGGEDQEQYVDTTYGLPEPQQTYAASDLDQRIELLGTYRGLLNLQLYQQVNPGSPEERVQEEIRTFVRGKLAELMGAPAPAIEAQFTQEQVEILRLFAMFNGTQVRYLQQLAQKVSQQPAVLAPPRPAPQPMMAQPVYAPAPQPRLPAIQPPQAVQQRVPTVAQRPQVTSPQRPLAAQVRRPQTQIRRPKVQRQRVATVDGGEMMIVHQEPAMVLAPPPGQIPMPTGSAMAMAMEQAATKTHQANTRVVPQKFVGQPGDWRPEGE